MSQTDTPQTDPELSVPERLAPEILADVTLDGNPVKHLYPGWEPTAHYEVIDSFSALLLTETATGQQACWWLENKAYCASHIVTLDPERQMRLLKALDPVFIPLAQGVLGKPPRDDAQRFLTTLPTIALRELAGVWLDHQADAIRTLSLNQASTNDTLTGSKDVSLDTDRLKALLKASRSAETMMVTSPFSGFPVRAQIALEMPDLTAYRFFDADSETVFYLMWDEDNPDLQPSFYHPDGYLLISDAPLGAFFPGWLLAWYAHHPDHAQRIQNARAFKPEDFGVGQASRHFLQSAAAVPAASDHETAPPSSSDASSPSSGAAPQARATPATRHERADWPSFLPPLPPETTAQPDSQLASRKNGLLSQLKALLTRSDKAGTVTERENTGPAHIGQKTPE